MYNFTEDEKKLLLKIARDAILYGLKHNKEMQITLANLPDKFKHNAATFVTITLNKELRGCIGSLFAHEALALDVAHNAFNAAFLDPRFAPLKTVEFSNIQIEISILTVPHKINFTNESELFAKINPGIDGLILTAGTYRATFLPSVWEMIPDKKKFLQQLKLKAGLASNYWSDAIIVEKYQVEKISE